MLYNRRKWQLIGKSQWCCSANCGHPLHALTYNWTRRMQLANTPPLQSTTPGLHPVSFHQMAPPVQGNTHPITAYYSVYYRPQKDERLSRPGWLVKYRNTVAPPGVEPGHVTHPSTKGVVSESVAVSSRRSCPRLRTSNVRSTDSASPRSPRPHTRWSVQRTFSQQKVGQHPALDRQHRAECSCTSRNMA